MFLKIDSSGGEAKKASADALHHGRIMPEETPQCN